MRRALDEAARSLRTAAHLRPEQVAHRIRLRTQKAVLSKWGAQIVPHLSRPTPTTAAWPAAFAAFDGPLAEPGNPTADRISFLSETRNLGSPPDWEQAGASQLWRYHLHYWEWAWSLAAMDDRLRARAEFAGLWHSWKAATTPGRWDAWSPYVVSVRTWVLCSVHHDLVAGSDWEPDFAADVALHAGFVAANLEYDVGGNHLLKNLKALTGAGVFLADEALLRKAERALPRQLEVQVLADGGHFERSPSYHCQVLGDLIDVAGILLAAGRPEVPGLAEAIERMRRWLGVMILPDGSIPLLNDCTPVDAARLTALKPRDAGATTLTVLQPSGYVVARAGPWHLVADVGPPCPPDLPAHAHADSLSFVLYMDGLPLIIDTGTSEYGAGARRQYERSTAAHNTVEVDGQDSTEVYGAFRAGRLARTTLERAHERDGAVVVAASHDGYRHLRGAVTHRRTWTLGPTQLEIVDELRGQGRHAAIARLHSPESIMIDGSTVRLGPSIAGIVGARPRVMAAGAEPIGVVAAHFGIRKPAACLELRAGDTLPLRVSVRFQLAGVGPNHGPGGGA